MRLAVSVLILSVASAAPAAGTSVVITDVTVVPMDSERVLAHRTVLVTDGVVAWIGPTGAVKTPKGAVRVNGHGKYLLPGLVDFHVRELTAKDPRAALPFLELAARLYPDEVSLHDNLGEARRLAGDAEGARRAFDAALALCPQDETARKGRAATGLDRGKLEP